VRRLLDALATALALAGGVLLLAVAVLTVVSVAGRWLADRPVTGDIELVQIATAVAIALFLPYAQVHGSHLIVDFFTARSSMRVQRTLDGAGSIAAAETTMVLGVPLWLAYAAMVPGLALAGVAGLVTSPKPRPPGSGA
jgi:TRAP-type C4-dicarboxylate transport system permease small subunit